MSREVDKGDRSVGWSRGSRLLESTHGRKSGRLKELRSSKSWKVRSQVVRSPKIEKPGQSIIL